MASLTLRVLTRSGDTTKNAPLTNAEIDQNFINIDADLALLAPIASPTFTGGVTVSGGGISVTGASSIVGDTQVTGGIGINMVPTYSIDVTGNGRLSGSFAVGSTTPSSNMKLRVGQDVDYTIGTDYALAITGVGYTGGLSLNADSMQVGHNSAVRDLTLHSGTAFAERVRVAGATGVVSMNAAVASTTTTTGTLVVTGGVGVSGQVTATTLSGSLAASNLTGTVAGDRGVTAGSATPSFVEYNGTTKTAGQFDGGTTAPTNTTRLNYDGYLYATRFYGDGSQLTSVAAATVTNGVYTTGSYADPSWITSLAFSKITGSGVLNKNVQVISTNTTAVSGRTYVLTASLTLTLPASPTAGMTVEIINRSGTTTCVVGRNAVNIMGLAEDMTLDDTNASTTLTYADATRGWVVND